MNATAISRALVVGGAILVTVGTALAFSVPAGLIVLGGLALGSLWVDL